MPVEYEDLLLYKSATVNETGTNGGRMSNAEIVSGAIRNCFPTIGEAERSAGSTKYRKVFLKNANDDDIGLMEAKVYLDKYTPGDDRIVFFPANQTNTQADITGSEKDYGAGKLNANISAGAASLVVLVEHGATQPFDIGDKIRITDKADIDASGNEEYVTVGSVGVSGDLVTLGFSPVTANGYAASNTRVMNVYEPGTDVAATTSDFLVTSGASGTYDEDYLFADNIGSVEQDWTLTFTSPTAFTISGNTLGSQGSSNIGSGASPNNVALGKPFFVLQAAGFGGTFQAGDTIEFSTHPSAVAIWLKRVVPAGAAELTVNEAIIVLDGETAG